MWKLKKRWNPVRIFFHYLSFFKRFLTLKMGIKMKKREKKNFWSLWWWKTQPSKFKKKFLLFFYSMAWHEQKSELEGARKSKTFFHSVILFSNHRHTFRGFFSFFFSSSPFSHRIANNIQRKRQQSWRRGKAVMVCEWVKRKNFSLYFSPNVLNS